MSFVGSVIKLITSKIAAQLIAFVTAPIIARVYLPEHFGTVQLFSSISGVISVISCLRYELSIPLGRNKNEVMSSFVISLASTSAVAVLSFIFVLILRTKIAIWLNAPEIKTFLWFLPLTVFLVGIGQALRYYAARSARFGAIAWADFGSSSGSILIPILLGLVFGASATFLFIGHIASAILNALIALAFLSREFLSDARTANLSLKGIWETTKYHKKFPIYDTWSALLNSTSLQLPPIILGTYFSTTVVGYYSLGYKFVGLPMSLLGYSISQVFFPTAAKEYNENGSIASTVGNTSRRLIQIGVFPMMVLGLLGAPIFSFVFGKNWVEASVYVQIMSPWIFFVFITSPLSTSFAVLNRQGTALAFNAGLVSSRLLALLVGSQAGQPRIALTAFVVVSVVGYIFMLLWIFYNGNVPIKWQIKKLLKYAFLSFVLLLPPLLISRIWHNVYIVFIALVFVGILYLYALYRIEQSVRSYINGILTNVLGVTLCRKSKELL